MNKNKTLIHDQKHLTLSDRTYIEQELLQGTSFKDIASVLGKDPTTISKEVRRNRALCHGVYRSERCYLCAFYGDCSIRGGDPHTRDCPRSSKCKKACSRCWSEDPKKFCSLFMPFQCDLIITLMSATAVGRKESVLFGTISTLQRMHSVSMRRNWPVPVKGST